jgi:hypothetical protein
MNGIAGTVAAAGLFAGGRPASHRGSAAACAAIEAEADSG